MCLVPRYRLREVITIYNCWFGFMGKRHESRAFLPFDGFSVENELDKLFLRKNDTFCLSDESTYPGHETGDWEMSKSVTLYQFLCMQIWTSWANCFCQRQRLWISNIPINKHCKNISQESQSMKHHVVFVLTGSAMFIAKGFGIYDLYHRINLFFCVLI